MRRVLLFNYKEHSSILIVEIRSRRQCKRDPAGKSSKLAGKLSRPAGKSSKLAGKSSKPAGKSSKLAGKPSKPAENHTTCADNGFYLIHILYLALYFNFLIKIYKKILM